MNARRLRRLGRGMRRAVASPPTAWLFVRMLAWKYAFALLKRVLPLKAVVRVARPRHVVASADAGARDRIEFILHRFGDDGDCLERSLVAYRFLTRAGAAPTLVIGIERDATRRGHAWVTVEGESVVESSDALQAFAPVATFDGAAGAK
jgi:hypothetical protein